MRDERDVATTPSSSKQRVGSQRLNFASCFRNKQTGGSSLAHITTKIDAARHLVVLLRRLPRDGAVIRIRIHAERVR